MAQKPLLVAIDFGALVERELRANGKHHPPRKARNGRQKPRSGEPNSRPAPGDLLRELESLGAAHPVRVRIYRTTVMCGAPLSAGIDSDD